MGTRWEKKKQKTLWGNAEDLTRKKGTQKKEDTDLQIKKGERNKQRAEVREKARKEAMCWLKGGDQRDRTKQQKRAFLRNDAGSTAGVDGRNQGTAEKFGPII